MTNAAIYARISQDRAGAGLGVARQEDDCRALAERLGWAVVGVFTDNDTSAYSGRPRPGYLAMLEAVRGGTVDAVLAWHTDRLHRSLVELEEYVDLGVTTQTVQAGELDLATPSGRLVARQLGAVARYESEHKGERVRRAQAQAAQAGRWLGGARPLGWKLRADGSAEIVPAEADRIRAAADMVLSGASLGSIVKAWNGDGFTTSTGRTWNYTSLRQVLSRARNAGLTEYRGEVIPTSVFPPILTEDAWRGVLATLADPSRRRSQTNRLRWILAGLARCHCGATVRSATAGGGRAYYRCRVAGPGHVARAAVPVDRFVGDVVVERLSRPDAVDLLTPAGPDVSEVRAEAAALRARIAGAGDLWEDGTLSDSEYRDRVGRLRGRLAAVEDRMASTSQAAAVVGLVRGDAAAVWVGLSPEGRRGAVDALMTVRLLPLEGRWSRVFHPELVEITWRQ